MGFAAAAFNFRSPHAMARIRFSFHGCLIGRGVETRPTGARVVFRIRTKQRLAAANALVGSGRLRVFVLTGEGWLGPLFPGHKVLILRELFLPGGIVLANLVFHGQTSVAVHDDTPRAISDSAQRLDVSPASLSLGSCKGAQRKPLCQKPLCKRR